MRLGTPKRPRRYGPVRGAGGRKSMVGPSELFDRSGTSTPVRTTTSPSMASSAVGPNAAQHQRPFVTPSAPAMNAGVNPLARARGHQTAG